MTVTADNNPLWLHWKKSQKEMELNLSLLREKISTAAVHDIRVAIKKLRALLSLYTQLQQEPEQEYPLHKTVAFFDVLGRYRDVEICLEQCGLYEKESGKPCPQLTAYFRQLLKTTRGWANLEIHRYHPKEAARVALLLKETGSHTDTAVFTGRLEALIVAQLSALKKHVKEPHVLRKRLKEIYYWIPLLPGEHPASWEPKLLHEILDDLGNWQDTEILDKRVQHFRKDYLPKPHEEYPILRELQDKTRAKKDSLEKSAVRKLKQWLKKVPGTPDL